MARARQKQFRTLTESSRENVTKTGKKVSKRFLFFHFIFNAFPLLSLLAQTHFRGGAMEEDEGMNATSGEEDAQETSMEAEFKKDSWWGTTTKRDLEKERKELVAVNVVKEEDSDEGEFMWGKMRPADVSCEEDED